MPVCPSPFVSSIHISVWHMISNWECRKEGENRPPSPDSVMRRARLEPGTSQPWVSPISGSRAYFSQGSTDLYVCFQTFAHVVSCSSFSVPAVAPGSLSASWTLWILANRRRFTRSVQWKFSQWNLSSSTYKIIHEIMSCVTVPPSSIMHILTKKRHHTLIIFCIFFSPHPTYQNSMAISWSH